MYLCHCSLSHSFCPHTAGCAVSCNYLICGWLETVYCTRAALEELDHGDMRAYSADSLAPHLTHRQCCPSGTVLPSSQRMGWAERGMTVDYYCRRAENRERERVEPFLGRPLAKTHFRATVISIAS